MKNIRTKFKFMLSFGLLTLLIVILGASAYTGVEVIKTQKELGAMVSEVNADVNSAVTASLIMLTDKDEASRGEISKQIQEGVEHISEFADKTESVNAKNLSESIIGQLNSFETLISELDKNNIQKSDIEMIISDSEKITAEISHLVEEIDERTLSRIDILNKSVIGVTSVAVILAILMSSYISSLIIVPLNRSMDFAREIAKGDFTKNIEVDRKDEFGALNRTLNEMVNDLREVLMEVKNSSEQAASASEQLSSASTQMNSGMEMQAESVSQIAGATTQMTQTVNEMTGNIFEIKKLSEDSSANVKEGVNQVRGG